MIIKDLYVYPVKSMAGQRVEQAELAARGFRHDRRWMLVDKNGRFISQREHAGLCRWEASLEEHLLILRHLDQSKTIIIKAPFAEKGQRTPVSVFDSKFEARLVEGFDASLLEQELGMSCRLVFMATDCIRELSPKYAKPGEAVSFADGYPYLIANEATRAALTERFGTHLDMLRFRPNIVVAGAEPFAEDSWTSMQLADAHFRIPKPCARCIVTTIDPTNGKKNARVFAHLARHRKVEDKIIFGVNAIWEGKEPQSLKVGDPVKI